MTTVATCSDISEAQLLKSLLDDAGIVASLPEEFTANSAPHLVFASGLRLQVADEDAAAARQIIAEVRTPGAEIPAESSPPGLPEKINLAEKFALFSDHWSPKIIAALNGQHVKLVKFRGEFVWHRHADEDELFFVVDGSFRMEFRDRTVELAAGELLVVPRGVEHRPVADAEVSVLLFEPAATVNTGSAGGARTVAAPEWI